jgi:single-stranded DNA-binding protein
VDRQPRYFDATIWTSLAEWTARHAQKGDKVVINGRLHWSEYQTTDGHVRQVIDVNANSLIHIPRRDPVERPADAADAANAAEDTPPTVTARTSRSDSP